MKSMMKRLFCVIVVSVLVFSVSAQEIEKKPKRSAEDFANTQTEMMIKDLSLSAEQGVKVKEINLNYAEKMKLARADKENGKAKMKELRKSKDAELKGVLTVDQYKKWQTLQKEDADKRKQNANKEKGGKGKQKGDTKDTQKQ